MPTLAHCPTCRQAYTVRDDMIGQQASCRCGQVFVIRPAAAAAPPPVLAPAAPPRSPALPPAPAAPPFAPPSPVAVAPPRTVTPTAPPSMPLTPAAPARRSNLLPLLAIGGGGLLLLLVGGTVVLIVAVSMWSKRDRKSTSADASKTKQQGDQKPDISEIEGRLDDGAAGGGKAKGKAEPLIFDPLALDDKLKIELDEPVNLPPPPGLWAGHWAMIRGLAFSPDGKLAVSASGDINDTRAGGGKGPDNSVRLWDARRGSELNPPKRLPFKEALSTVAFSPGGRYVACASGGRWVGGSWVPGTDKNVHLWDVLIGREVFALKFESGRPSEAVGEARFKGHTENVICVTFSPDGKRVAACSGDGVILIWETDTGKEIRRIKQVTAAGPRISADLIHSIAFSRDGKYLMSGGYDYTVRLWDVAAGTEVRRMTAHTDRVFSVAVRQEGDTLLGLSGGGSQWGFNAFGKVTVVPGTRDYTVRLWDLKQGTILHSFVGHTRDVQWVAFSPNGRHVISAGFDKTVRVWDRATGAQLRSFEHEFPVRCVVVRPDAKYALAGDDGGNIRHWQLPE